MQIYKSITIVCALIFLPIRLTGQIATMDTIRQEVKKDTINQVLSKEKSDKNYKSFVQRMLEIFGITSVSSMQKNAEIVSSGQVWICASDGTHHRQITQGAEFRSPIFLPGNQDIVALMNNNIVAIRLTDNSLIEMMPIENAIKIIGFDKNNSVEIYLLCKNESGKHRIIHVNLETLKRDDVDYNATDVNDRLALNVIEADERKYGDVRLYTQSITDFVNMEERKGIFIQKNDCEALQVTKGMEGNFEQPSLSYDKKMIVFIKMRSI